MYGKSGRVRSAWRKVNRELRGDRKETTGVFAVGVREQQRTAALIGCVQRFISTEGTEASGRNLQETLRASADPREDGIRLHAIVGLVDQHMHPGRQLRLVRSLDDAVGV